MFPGCSKSNDGKVIESNEETKLDSVDSNNVDDEKSEKELLIRLANQEFNIQQEKLTNEDEDTIINFGKSFVNLYNGAIAEQEKVTFEKYIGNKNLLEFTDKYLSYQKNNIPKVELAYIMDWKMNLKKLI